jgi:hypothetical protein
MVQNMLSMTSLSSKSKQDFLSLPNKSDFAKVAGGNHVERTSSGSLIFMLAGSKSVPAVPITTQQHPTTTITTTKNKGDAARRAIDLYDELLGDDSMSSLTEFAGMAASQTLYSAVCASSVEQAVTPYKPYSESETVEMLQGICQDHATIMKKTKILDKCIADQLELATARHAIGSTRGIAVSMSKIARIHQERERIQSALEILERHAENIQSKLNQVRGEGTHGLDWASTNTDVVLDLRAHEGYKQELDKILAGITVGCA